MPTLEDLGMQAATAGVGGIMGMMMGDWNDQRQIKQQRELQRMQEGGNKRMMDYAMMKQLEMWQNTSYAAQKQQMLKAGLNPALMYGMSGGGGQTTGSATGSVGSGTAPSGGGELGMGIQSAMQLQLLKAQKENIEADTANKEADIPVKGAQVPNIEANTQSTLQNIKNAKVQETILGLDAKLKGKTLDDMEDLARWTAEKAKFEMEREERENYVDKATRDKRIDMVTAELTGIYVKNALVNAQIEATRAGTVNTQKDTQLKGAQMEKIGQEITNMITEMGQKWYGLSLEERKTAMTERLVKFNTAISQRTYDNILRGVQTISGAVKPGTTINQGPRETQIHNY